MIEIHFLKQDVEYGRRACSSLQSYVWQNYFLVRANLFRRVWSCVMSSRSRPPIRDLSTPPTKQHCRTSSRGLCSLQTLSLRETWMDHGRTFSGFGANKETWNWGLNPSAAWWAFAAIGPPFLQFLYPSLTKRVSGWRSLRAVQHSSGWRVHSSSGFHNK